MRALTLIFIILLLFSCDDSSNTNINDNCSTHKFNQCFRENVYWFDSCNKLEEIKETCNENQICKNIDDMNAICEDKIVDCSTHSYKKCINNDIYWFDSCDIEEDLFKSCENNTLCSNEDNSFLCVEIIDDLCLNNSACKDNYSDLKINKVTENNIFYVDSVNGNDNNNGSVNSPWKNLQKVVDTKIKTKEYDILPYSENSVLIGKNINAPVKSGDIIILKAGNYGNLDIKKSYNDDFITIRGESAYLSKVSITGSSKFRLQFLNITHYQAGITKEVLISIRNNNYFGNVNNIIIDRCKISSIEDSSLWTLSDWLANSSNGIRIDGENIVLFKNKIKNVNVAISLEGKNSVAINNTIENFTEDGIRALASNILVENNIIRNCYNVNTNHNDGIQSYVLDDIPISNVILRNNKIYGHIMMNYNEEGNVGLQGIGCFDGFYENWVVENNLIIVDNWHGITFRAAKNVKILNNTIIDLNNDNTNNKPSPWIMIESHKDGRVSTILSQIK